MPEEGRSESPASSISSLSGDNAAAGPSTQSASASSCSTSHWTSEQTATLVALGKENNGKIESADIKTTWDRIVIEVNQFPEKKTLKQCKDKIRNLKQLYKEAKHQNKQSGNAPQTSPFFEDFDEALGNRPVITMPRVKRCGQAPGTAQSSSPDQGSAQIEISPQKTTTQEGQGGKGKPGAKGKGPIKRKDDGESPVKKSPVKKRRRSTGRKAEAAEDAGGFKAQLLKCLKSRRLARSNCS